MKHKALVCAAAVGAGAVAVLLVLGARAEKRGDAVAKPAVAPSQAEQPAVSVAVVTVQERELQSWLYSQGTARSRQREFLTFTQQGSVSYVDPRLRVGSTVKAGQLLAHQAPERVRAELRAAKAAVSEADANLALAEVTRRRYQTLIEQESASRQELDEAVVKVQQGVAARDNALATLAQAQVGLDESRLVSPINGVLARLNIEKGRYFSTSSVQTDSEQSALRTVPALVIDPRRFEVRVDMPSYVYKQIASGARAVVGDSPPGDADGVDPEAVQGRMNGRVYATSPSLNPDTRTFEVVVHVDPGPNVLQDGEFVAVWIAEPQLTKSLTVPLEAVRYRNDQAFVFVAEAPSGRVSERRVELGQQSGNYRAVSEGLAMGERVVTDGRAALKDGQRVRVIQKATP